MTSFSDFNLSEPLITAISRLNYTTPTPVQEQAIPEITSGRDVLGTAQTGTGKTAAFVIPMIEFLLRNTNENSLILLPTRELASQVEKNVSELSYFIPDMKTALLIGGENIEKQIKDNARVFIGTPGRINDHIRAGNIDLSKTTYVVLDEMDRMLDMGFAHQIATIMAKTPKKRQTLMFSATFPPNIKTEIDKYLKSPKRIKIGETWDVAESVIQKNIRLSEEEKFDRLVNILNENTGTALVFVRIKYHAEKLAKKLLKYGIEAGAVHGDLRQNKRDRVITAFRNMKFQVLVATDLASRGLDIPHIETVVNYDLPQCPEDYIHRIGRTARAGASGTAINLLSPADFEKWRAISKLVKHTSENRPTAEKVSKKYTEKNKNKSETENKKEKLTKKRKVKITRFKYNKNQHTAKFIKINKH